MDQVFAFIEGVSRRLLDREPAQILLIHANALNADHLGALLDRAAARGYRFVPLDGPPRPRLRAARRLRRELGISWLHHCEITMGRARSPFPDPPRWVMEEHEGAGR